MVIVDGVLEVFQLAVEWLIVGIACICLCKWLTDGLFLYPPPPLPPLHHSSNALLV